VHGACCNGNPHHHPHRDGTGRCFTHEELVAAFGHDDWDVDLMGRTSRVCHKHCLHSLNFVIKHRFDEFRDTSGFTGLPPDVSPRPSCCMPYCTMHWTGQGKALVLG
jgi:hypothetical protein